MIGFRGREVPMDRVKENISFAAFFLVFVVMHLFSRLWETGKGVMAAKVINGTALTNRRHPRPEGPAS